MKQTLSPDDLARCYELGKRRDSNHATARNLSLTREQTHINGLKGEIAFANRYGLEVDTEDRPDGDEYDFLVEWSGFEVTVDVKTTSYTNDPWLKVRKDHVKADVYVLATVDGCTVELIGYEVAATVGNKEPSDKTGHLENHILTAGELKELPEQSEINQI